MGASRRWWIAFLVWASAEALALVCLLLGFLGKNLAAGLLFFGLSLIAAPLSIPLFVCTIAGWKKLLISQRVIGLALFLLYLLALLAWPTGGGFKLIPGGD